MRFSQKLYILILISISFFSNSYCQEIQKINKLTKEQVSVNVILVVDGELVNLHHSRLYSKSTLVLKNSDEEKIFEIGYLPGSLFLNQDHYEMLVNDLSKVHTLHLEMDQWALDKNGNRIREKFRIYDIPIAAPMLKKPYLVIKIYNLDVKEYARKYLPYKDEKYTFELFSNDRVRFAELKK